MSVLVSDIAHRHLLSKKVPRLAGALELEPHLFFVKKPSGSNVAGDWRVFFVPPGAIPSVLGFGFVFVFFGVCPSLHAHFAACYSALQLNAKF